MSKPITMADSRPGLAARRDRQLVDAGLVGVPVPAARGRGCRPPRRTGSARPGRSWISGSSRTPKELIADLDLVGDVDAAIFVAAAVHDPTAAYLELGSTGRIDRRRRLLGATRHGQPAEPAASPASSISRWLGVSGNRPMPQLSRRCPVWKTGPHAAAEAGRSPTIRGNRSNLLLFRAIARAMGRSVSP